MNPALIQRIQERKIHISTIKNDDFPSFDPGAKFRRALAVMLTAGVDNRETRQKALHIQAQMAFGRSFPAAVLGQSKQFMTSLKTVESSTCTVRLKR